MATLTNKINKILNDLNEEELQEKKLFKELEKCQAKIERLKQKLYKELEKTGRIPRQTTNSDVYD